VSLYNASLGSGQPGQGYRDKDQNATGRVLDDRELARLVAIAEAAERYTGLNLNADVVWATVADLPGPVMDMSRLPRCSAREYAHPGCRLAPFDERASIRWVKGVDLSSGAETWMPAVMACYGVHASPAERFWYQISTGFAVHTDSQKALVNAILEVIERDSIAIVWLQRLPLPPLAQRLLSEHCRYLLDWTARHFIDTYLFDATTDLGVPAVYSLEIAEHDRSARQVVGCGTGSTMAEAAERALLESLTLRPLYYSDEPLPTDVQEFTDLLHGARYMALPEQAHAFEFLLDGMAERQPSDGQPDLSEDPGEALRHLVGVLSANGMQAIAVDRTPRELADVGLTAVTVVIPDLQPMSLHPLAQFRAHPRLYAAPRKLGYRCLPEEELNPWPQPFS
jgi:ribosomal protein S12 methylthiotransferase accessory factor